MSSWQMKFTSGSKHQNKLTLKILHFRDLSEMDAIYEPIAVIEHLGRITDRKTSEGHYICDVKDKKSDRWHRTNDSKMPVMIKISDVTKQGYVVLLKRK